MVPTAPSSAETSSAQQQPRREEGVQGGNRRTRRGEIGLVITMAVLLGLTGGLALYLWRYKQSKKKEEASSPSTAGMRERLKMVNVHDPATGGVVAAMIPMNKALGPPTPQEIAKDEAIMQQIGDQLQEVAGILYIAGDVGRPLMAQLEANGIPVLSLDVERTGRPGYVTQVPTLAVFGPDNTLGLLATYEEIVAWLVQPEQEHTEQPSHDAGRVPYASSAPSDALGMVDLQHNHIMEQRESAFTPLVSAPNKEHDTQPAGGSDNWTADDGVVERHGLRMTPARSGRGAKATPFVARRDFKPTVPKEARTGVEPEEAT